MIKIFFIIFIASFNLTFAQTVDVSATYYEGGVNSPWMVGIDYDLGFAKVLSFNAQFSGGVSSQVNRASTFGDVFLGELQLGLRLYMNKIDTWNGLFLNIVGRVGIYNVPIRSRPDPFTVASKLIIDRSNMFQYGMGIYIGYRWTKNLVNDMSDFPFYLIIEPYLGWTLDSFLPLTTPAGFNQQGLNISRFSIGLTFKVGFYTHKKSKATIEREAREAREAAKASTNQTNTTNTTNTQANTI